MGAEHIQPPGLFQAEGMRHVVVATGRTTYIAGQGAYDENFQLVGRGDLTAEKTDVLVQAMGKALAGEPFPPNTSTLVGVTRVAYPEMLIEISAIAVLGDSTASPA